MLPKFIHALKSHSSYFIAVLRSSNLFVTSQKNDTKNIPNTKIDRKLKLMHLKRK